MTAAPPDSTSLLRRVMGNASFNLAATAIRLSIGFVLTPILLRHFGPSTYGVWSLVTTFSVTGALTLLSLGLQTHLVRTLAAARAIGDDKRYRETLSATIAAYVALGGLGSAALLLLASLAGRIFAIPTDLVVPAQLLLWLLAAQTLVDLPGLAVDGVLEAAQSYGLRSGLEVGRAFAFAIGAATLISLDAPITALGMLALAITVLGVAVSLVVLNRRPGALALARPTARQVFAIIRESASLFLFRLNAVIYGQMDRVLLGALVSTAAIAHYDIAQRIHGFALVAQSFASPVVLPAASQAFAAGKSADVSRLFVTLTRQLTLIAGLVSGALVILAQPFVETWIGQAYAADGVLVQLFLAYTFVWPLTGAGWNIALAASRTRDLLGIALSTTALNLVLSIALTLMIGTAGVVLATFIANCVAVVLYARLIISLLELPWTVLLQEVFLRAYAAVVPALGVLAVGAALRRPDSLLEVGLDFAVTVALGVVLYGTLFATSSERRAFARGALS